MIIIRFLEASFRLLFPYFINLINKLQNYLQMHHDWDNLLQENSDTYQKNANKICMNLTAANNMVLSLNNKQTYLCSNSNILHQRHNAAQQNFNSNKGTPIIQRENAFKQAKYEIQTSWAQQSKLQFNQCCRKCIKKFSASHYKTYNESLKHFPNEQQLNLSYCTQLQKIELLNCQKLKKLDLSHTKISDQFLKKIFQLLPNLEQLNLSYCSQLSKLQLKNSHLKKIHLIQVKLNKLSLESLHNLQQINLSNSDRAITIQLKNCPNLKTLHLNNRNISFLLCQQLSGLRQLYINSCKVSQIKLRKCESLKIIRINDTKIRQLLFEQNQSLQQVYLVHCYEFNTIKQKNCHQLNIFDLSFTKFTTQNALKQIVKKLRQTASKLEQLRLYGHEKLVFHIQKDCQNLKAIDLKYQKPVKSYDQNIQQFQLKFVRNNQIVYKQKKIYKELKNIKIFKQFKKQEKKKLYQLHRISQTTKQCKKVKGQYHKLVPKMKRKFSSKTSHLSQHVSSPSKDDADDNKCESESKNKNEKNLNVEDLHDSSCSIIGESHQLLRESQEQYYLEKQLTEVSNGKEYQIRQKILLNLLIFNAYIQVLVKKFIQSSYVQQIQSYLKLLDSKVCQPLVLHFPLNIIHVYMKNGQQLLNFESDSWPQSIQWQQQSFRNALLQNQSQNKYGDRLNLRRASEYQMQDREYQPLWKRSPTTRPKTQSQKDDKQDEMTAEMLQATAITSQTSQIQKDKEDSKEPQKKQSQNKSNKPTQKYQTITLSRFIAQARVNNSVEDSRKIIYSQYQNQILFQIYAETQQKKQKLKQLYKKEGKKQNQNKEIEKLKNDIQENQIQIQQLTENLKNKGTPQSMMQLNCYREMLKIQPITPQQKLHRLQIVSQQQKFLGIKMNIFISQFSWVKQIVDLSEIFYLQITRLESKNQNLFRLIGKKYKFMVIALYFLLDQKIKEFLLINNNKRLEELKNSELNSYEKKMKQSYIKANAFFQKQSKQYQKEQFIQMKELFMKNKIMENIQAIKKIVSEKIYAKFYGKLEDAKLLGDKVILAKALKQFQRFRRFYNYMFFYSVTQVQKLQNQQQSSQFQEDLFQISIQNLQAEVQINEDQQQVRINVLLREACEFQQENQQIEKKIMRCLREKQSFIEKNNNAIKKNLFQNLKQQQTKQIIDKLPDYIKQEFNPFHNQNSNKKTQSLQNKKIIQSQSQASILDNNSMSLLNQTQIEQINEKNKMAQDKGLIIETNSEIFLKQNNQKQEENASKNKLIQNFEKKEEQDKKLKTLKQQLKICQKENGKYTEKQLNLVNKIGQIYDQKGDYDKTLQYYFRANEISMNIKGKNSSECATSLHMIGSTYEKKNYNDEALEYLLKSLEIRKNVLTENNPDYAQSLHSIGLVYYHEGEYSEALEYLFKSLEIRKKVLGENHPDYAASLNSVIQTQHYCLYNYIKHQIIKQKIKVHLQNIQQEKEKKFKKQKKLSFKFNESCLLQKTENESLANKISRNIINKLIQQLMKATKDNYRQIQKLKDIKALEQYNHQTDIKLQVLLYIRQQLQTIIEEKKYKISKPSQRSQIELQMK